MPNGIATDVTRGVRPGVPRERVPSTDPGAHGRAPGPQHRGVPATGARPGAQGATVFGTAQPLRGLSGVLRRAAYRTPEHRTARWMLLLAGDRVDLLEHRLARALWVLPAAAALAIGYSAASRLLRR